MAQMAEAAHFCLGAFKQIFIDNRQKPEWSTVAIFTWALGMWLIIGLYEHINRELWLHITGDLFKQQQLELNISEM